jgi:hypothetical protein
MRRRTATLVAALTALSVAAAAAPAATNYSYIKTGTYSGTAKVPQFDGTSPPLRGSTFPVSFKVTAKTRKGIRSVRSLALGPILMTCSNTSARPTQYRQLPLPRQAGFPPVATNGFIIRSWVLRGGHWKAGPVNQVYTGTLPHVDLQLVYNKKPARFNPNPVSNPSVIYEVHVDDQNRIDPRGDWLCSVKSVVTLKRA